MAGTLTYDRYQRQILLPGFGTEGQSRLLQAKVLVIGAGGLGCPILQYLAAAGVGTIGIADDDLVAIHNLHRQVLFTTNDIGKPKASTAAAVLKKMNPEIEIIAMNDRVTNQNVLDLVHQFDIIVDGSDNFSTRYLVNDACVILGKPLVYGAISQFDAQVAVFDNKFHYRHLFPVPPAPGTVLNCAEAGVLGVLPGIAGIMMANETIKLITGIGESLNGRLLIWNALNNQSYILELQQGTKDLLTGPMTGEELKVFDYDFFCGINNAVSISPDQLSKQLEAGKMLIIDVREKNESPSGSEWTDLQLPFSTLTADKLPIGNEPIVFVCQTGKRSATAVFQLSIVLEGSRQLYSLQGGILKWIQFKSDEQGA
jgi:molybdopterin/thiamine biosynthesis adenylyltransferase/rhodanese-related sulfurtransferase